MSSRVDIQLFDSVFYPTNFIGYSKENNVNSIYGIYQNKTNRVIIKGELVQLNNSNNSVIITKNDANAPYNTMQSFGVVLDDTIEVNGYGKIVFGGLADVLLEYNNTVYFYDMVGRSTTEGRVKSYTQNATFYNDINFVGIPTTSLKANDNTTYVRVYIPPKV